MKTRIPDESKKRLLINLGCGPFAKASSWTDYDGSWNVLASRLPLGLGWLGRKILGHKGSVFPNHVHYLNVTKRLPFPDRSVDAIYYSHMLEHLHLEEGRQLLKECHRVMKPGAIIRILVPDTEYFIQGYLKRVTGGDATACYALNEQLGYRVLTSRGNVLRRLYTAVTDFHTHKFMYDRIYLREILLNSNFVEVKDAIYNDSRIPEVSEIELSARLGNGLGFGLEAEKP